MDTLESKKGHGQRMRKLENAFHVTVKYAFRGMPLEEFQTYFPPGSIPPHHTEAAYNGYRQVSRISVDDDAFSGKMFSELFFKQIKFLNLCSAFIKPEYT